MNGLPLNLSVELLASGLVGLLLLGGLVKRVIEGYVEAQKNLRSQQNNPIVAMAASAWDENQRERFLQLMEALVKTQEAQAASMAALVSRQQEEMREQLQYLIERVDHEGLPNRRSRIKPK